MIFSRTASSTFGAVSPAYATTTVSGWSREVTATAGPLVIAKVVTGNGLAVQQNEKDSKNMDETQVTDAGDRPSGKFITHVATFAKGRKRYA